MEKFCLNWDDFESNIKEYFRELRDDQNYFDVTLATDDGHAIEAHKIILSAGSKFFSNILRQTKHPSPFIYLKGINKVELEYVLDFLYNGEAFMAQEELNDFLQIAQELQVKGLQNNKEDEDNQNNEVEFVSVKLEEIEPNAGKPEETVIQESMSDSLEELIYDDRVAKEEDKGKNINIKLDFQIYQMIEKNEGLWKCKVCRKTSNKKYIVKQHA